MNLLIDLCAGLGGASEDFMNDNHWTVWRFDNSEKVKDVEGMQMIDLRNEWTQIVEKFRSAGPFDMVVVWASPPCEQWSGGYASQLSKAKRSGEEFIPDLSLVNACMGVIDGVNPDHWILENVVMGQEFINPLLGEATLKHRPWIFWGRFPLFHIGLPHNHKSKVDKWSSRDPMRYHKRSKIPIQISRAFKDALEGQTSLEDFQ